MARVMLMLSSVDERALSLSKVVALCYSPLASRSLKIPFLLSGVLRDHTALSKNPKLFVRI